MEFGTKAWWAACDALVRSGFICQQCGHGRGWSKEIQEYRRRGDRGLAVRVVNDNGEPRMLCTQCFPDKPEPKKARGKCRYTKEMF